MHQSKTIRVKRVFLAVSLDIFELPLAVFETIIEGATYCGCSIPNFCKNVREGRVDYKNNCKYVKVDIDEDEENVNE